MSCPRSFHMVNKSAEELPLMPWGNQLREGPWPQSHAMADAGTSMDGRDEGQEGQHGEVPTAGLELDGLMTFALMIETQSSLA